MNNQEDRNVSKAWVSLQYAERNSPEFDSLFWAHTRRNLGASSRCDLNMGIGKTITHTVDADTPLSADEQAMLVRLRLIANVSLSQLRKPRRSGVVKSLRC